MDIEGKVLASYFKRSDAILRLEPLMTKQIRFACGGTEPTGNACSNKKIIRDIKSYYEVSSDCELTLDEEEDSDMSQNSYQLITARDLEIEFKRSELSAEKNYGKDGVTPTENKCQETRVDIRESSYSPRRSAQPGQPALESNIHTEIPAVLEVNYSNISTHTANRTNLLRGAYRARNDLLKITKGVHVTTSNPGEVQVRKVFEAHDAAPPCDKMGDFQCAGTRAEDPVSAFNLFIPNNGIETKIAEQFLINKPPSLFSCRGGQGSHNQDDSQKELISVQESKKIVTCFKDSITQKIMRADFAKSLHVEKRYPPDGSEPGIRRRGIKKCTVDDPIQKPTHQTKIYSIHNSDGVSSMKKSSYCTTTSIRPDNQPDPHSIGFTETAGLNCSSSKAKILNSKPKPRTILQNTLDTYLKGCNKNVIKPDLKNRIRSCALQNNLTKPKTKFKSLEQLLLIGIITPGLNVLSWSPEGVKKEATILADGSIMAEGKLYSSLIGWCKSVSGSKKIKLGILLEEVFYNGKPIQHWIYKHNRNGRKKTENQKNRILTVSHPNELSFGEIKSVNVKHSIIPQHGSVQIIKPTLQKSHQVDNASLGSIPKNTKSSLAATDSKANNTLSSEECTEGVCGLELYSHIRLMTNEELFPCSQVEWDSCFNDKCITESLANW